MAVVLVGQPNVGKSSILTRLTGAKVIVSNYPGTSFELVRGEIKTGGRRIEIIDAPGVYSLYHASAEETITRDLVKSKVTELIFNVVDATNLGRNLVLTFELIELGKPIVVLLNQIDRARADGIEINHNELSKILGCQVFPFSAVTGEGVMEVLDYLRKGLSRGFPKPEVRHDLMNGLGYYRDIHCCGGNCSRCLKKQEIPVSSDEFFWKYCEKARNLARRVSSKRSEGQKRWFNRVERFVDHPFVGTITLLVLAFLGFETLISFVGWAEKVVESTFVPVQKSLAAGISYLLPSGFWNHVLSKGVPEGLLVPFALVMPTMLMVSILMSLVEDTGLLPRYAVVLERFGRLFGVSGQAVIPLSLGFGCRTPAVIATRILASPAQRFIVITLLSIVVPCASTIGILTSVVAAFHAYIGVIISVILAVFVILGYLLKKSFGEKSELLYELPPLRIPIFSNVASKVRMRFSGFFTEILPLLLVMSIGVRVVLESGALNRLEEIDFLSRLLFGIPAKAFVAVLVTVIQKYLAPLLLLNLELTPKEATIAISMIALSLPCMPVMVMTWREMGGRALVKIAALGLVVSFTVGVVLNLVLPR